MRLQRLMAPVRCGNNVSSDSHLREKCTVGSVVVRVGGWDGNAPRWLVILRLPQ